MKKDKKRQSQLTDKAQSESLLFQTMWGAKQKFSILTSEIETRIREELLVFNNLHLAEDILTLKNTIESFTKDLCITSEPSRGILARSLVAFCLGL